jgi:fused signal recognition particle receptor
VTATPWFDALDRTRRAALGRLARFLGTSELDDQAWEDLEAALIQADVGVLLAGEITSSLRALAAHEGITRADQVHAPMRDLMIRMLAPAVPPAADPPPPEVRILVGVNGGGKTTSAAKLAGALKRQGRHVLLAAADTFRVAADQQLQAWADRLGIEVIVGPPGSDPGAVVYEAGQAALARSADVVLVDTSGRMHTRHNLMAELEKVCRVAGKVIPGAPHEVYLVLDATTGQNGLQQARGFAAAVPLTGVILAKLDSSARGGIGLAVAHDMKLPIRFAGIGEGPDDLVAFDPAAYVDGLLAHR